MEGAPRAAKAVPRRSINSHSDTPWFMVDVKRLSHAYPCARFGATYAELQAFKAGGVGVRLTALARRVLGRDAVPALDALQMVSAPRLPSAQIPADPRLAAVQLVRTLVARFAWVAPSFSVVLTATTPVIWGW